MNELELLSPAGDIEIFKAVVNAGADAVYFGGDLFGARAYAKNFSIEEAASAIKYGHLHGVKSYLTVNTLLKNPEIEGKLYDYLRAYVENGIDAFIVQDFGVFSFIREYFPDTHIHVSTQASICTKYGAKFFEGLGASRIVTAREISTGEISKIHEACPDLEIESFIHGALCVCYSGQCLMSSILGGRSGNRGRCAQPCRLPYEAYYEGKHINKNGNYILSPKDFCTIEYLPEMIGAGVMSFKIEGRMKQLEYAAGVVSVYRHYLDEYLYKGSRNYSVNEEDMRKLLDFGNRSGFTSLYLHEHNGPQMISFDAPGHTKAESNFEAPLENKIAINCKVTALLGKEFKITFTDENGNKGECVSDIIQGAQKRAATREDIEKAVSGLGNTSFKINRLDVEFDDGIFLPVSLIKNARREAIAALTVKCLSSKKSVIYPYTQVKELDNSKTCPSCFVTVLTKSQLEVVASKSFVDSVAVPAHLFNTAKAIFKGEIYILLPEILRADYIDKLEIFDEANGVIASSFDQLGYLKDSNYPSDKIILNHRIYSYNNRAINAFYDLDISRSCIPYELSLKELKHRNNKASQMIVYARIPMMITANCTVKNTLGCDKSNKQISLVDRKNEKFTVVSNCKYCYNTIYNSKKYIAFDLKNEILSLGLKELRLDFTIESNEEVDEILSAYNQIFNQDKQVRFLEDYTKGHLKRGVE